MVEYAIAVRIIGLPPIPFAGFGSRGHIWEISGRLAVVAWVGSRVITCYIIKVIIQSVPIAVATGRSGVRGIVAIGIPAF